MKLCIIANPNSVHTHRWVAYFVARGHQVHLIGEEPPLRPPPEGAVFHDLTRRCNVRKVRYLAWALAVRRLVRGIHPDVLHAHNVAGAGWLGAASGYHPFLLTAHGSDLLLLSQRSPAHRWLSKFALRRADYVACSSRWLVDKARALGVPAERVEAVYLGVDVEVFHPASDKAAIRAKLGLPEAPTVLSLRAIRPVYNPLDIARAIPHVLAHVPSARFLILTYNADARLLARFQALVRECGASEAVTFVGELAGDEVIADYCRAADVAVSVPASDSAPTSVQQAMACGTPVVLSDLPALHEWMEHEREGLFVPVGNVAALAAALVRLLKDEDLRRRLGANAAQTIRERGDSRIWMARSEEIYRWLAQQGRSQRD